MRLFLFLLLLLYAARSAGILQPHIALSSTKLWCIHGHEQAFTPAFLRMLDDASRDGAVLIDLYTDEKKSGVIIMSSLANQHVRD